ncbi:MmcQ/YjbR family DNA-binding protein [Maritalea mobilis]|uniref:MmcQ/YjbR family DNA-binding protein n=1 Tax=Maritalea mobilis TaxID=483324 RepID=UPI001C983C28|nr:MmcQ/YjbR family DNA-binding protein [Maritalea mobilis]MBY6200426.1 MmcQ/YjbR family DNA-binding protein [Maritalea mobilis]
MRERFVDNHCQRLPGAERTEPFGPGTVVWKVEGHMFAAYSIGGHGLSLRMMDAKATTRMVEQGRAAPHFLEDEGGWVLLPWETHPDELRAHLELSYRLVLFDGNRA